MVHQLENRVERVEKQNERILTLVKAVRDHQKKLERQRFTIDDSPYKVWISIGKQISGLNTSV